MFSARFGAALAASALAGVAVYKYQETTVQAAPAKTVKLIIAGSYAI